MGAATAKIENISLGLGTESGQAIRSLLVRAGSKMRKLLLEARKSKCLLSSGRKISKTIVCIIQSIINVPDEAKKGAVHL